MRQRAVAVRGVSRHGVFREAGSLVPGKQPGELDLVEVHAPCHGDDRTGHPRRSESEQARDYGLTHVGCCEHASPSWPWILENLSTSY